MAQQIKLNDIFLGCIAIFCICASVMVSKNKNLVVIVFIVIIKILFQRVVVLILSVIVAPMHRF